MYKKLDKNHRFNRANAQNQVPIECLNFNYCGKHCWNGTLGDYETTATNCVVLKGEFCSKYKTGA